jgi:hypothetical protein
MKSILKTMTLVFAMMTLVTHAEEAPKTPAPISKDAKHPEGVDVKLMSDDPTYGFSEKNPVKVGSKDEYGGPKAEREYLDSLLDPTGKEVKYARLGSGGGNTQGKPLDIYEITFSSGEKFTLWIDMYQPKNKPLEQPSPVGLYKKKR